MRYQPRHYTFRAVLWRGDLADLPSEWLSSGLFTLDDGVLICHTKHGPSAAAPNGEWYIAELPDRADTTELYPVRRDIFEAKYQAVPE